jgi:hypothetical protein
MNNPLWDRTNTTLFSSVFNVAAGQVCVLQAANFEKWAYRQDASQIQVQQMVCVRRVLHDFVVDGIARDQCGWIFNLDNVRSEKIVDAFVQTCGVPWQLTLCKNIGIIGLPGSYRLELNDATAIGIAQVYAEVYDAKSIPLQLQNLFFQ